MGHDQHTEALQLVDIPACRGLGPAGGGAGTEAATLNVTCSVQTDHTFSVTFTVNNFYFNINSSTYSQIISSTFYFTLVCDVAG